ncbi:MAG: hypothetical protein IKF72_09785, partial [Kiritimatiellae bacterium]|nr:hypothetical protein [Kiritimatiellia bacterium]
LTTQNGVDGYVVRGRGDYASNSIFLPCVGWGYKTSLFDAGSYGGYWSSVPHSEYSNSAWYLSFNLSDHYTYNNYRYRYYGLPIRPVQGAAK